MTFQYLDKYLWSPRNMIHIMCIGHIMSMLWFYKNIQQKVYCLKKINDIIVIQNDSYNLKYLHIFIFYT